MGNCLPTEEELLLDKQSKTFDVDKYAERVGKIIHCGCRDGNVNFIGHGSFWCKYEGKEHAVSTLYLLYTGQDTGHIHSEDIEYGGYQGDFLTDQTTFYTDRPNTNDDRFTVFYNVGNKDKVTLEYNLKKLEWNVNRFNAFYEYAKDKVKFVKIFQPDVVVKGGGDGGWFKPIVGGMIGGLMVK